MTFEELVASKKEFLVPSDIADLIGCMPYSINIQAKKDPKGLGFPVTVMRSRVRIPRRAFIEWLTRGIEHE